MLRYLDHVLLGGYHLAAYLCLIVHYLRSTAGGGGLSLSLLAVDLRRHGLDYLSLGVVRGVDLATSAAGAIRKLLGFQSSASLSSCSSDVVV